MIHCFHQETEGSASGLTGSKPIHCSQCSQMSQTPCYHKFKVRYKSCRSDTPVQKRSNALSCSDKIIKWNFLGVQGSKLATYYHPIYFSSITIGNVQSKSMAERQVISKGIHDSLDIFIRLPENKAGAILSLPQIHLLNTEEKSYLFAKRIEPGYRASGFSLGWQIRDKTSQIIVGTLGLKQGSNKHSVPKLAVACSICNHRLFCQLLKEEDAEVAQRKCILKLLSEQKIKTQEGS